MESSISSDSSMMGADIDVDMDARSIAACSDTFSLYSFNSMSSYSTYTTMNVSRGCKNVMNDKDKCIYNMLGSSSSPVGKPTYMELGLHREWQKRDVMWKTGPNPSWYSKWNKRLFILKGNFLYYFGSHKTQMALDAPVLGAIYLKNAVIEKVSLSFAKRVLRITPPVPRRRSWESAEEGSSTFYIKFKKSVTRDEWYEDLQQVSFGNEFPTEQPPLITHGMKFITCRV